MSRWKTAKEEAEQERGVRFLCRHGEHLGVPYKWSSVLTSLVCSLYDDGLLIGLDGSGRIAGALAYTSGTDMDGYRDRTKIEVHLLFIEERMRTGMMLLEAMRALAEKTLESPDGIGEIVFYAVPSAGNRRLFGKFAVLAHTTEFPCGMLDCYKATPEQLLNYVSLRGA